MSRASDVQKRRLRPSSRTIFMMTLTPILSCLKRFPNLTTISTGRGAHVKEENRAAQIIIAWNIEKHFSSCSKKTDKSIPMDPTMQQLPHRLLSFLSAIFVPCAVFRQTTAVLHVELGFAVYGAFQLIKTPAASSSLTKRQAINSSVVDIEWRWRRRGGEANKEKTLSVSLWICN